MKRALVTGGSGDIGSVICQKLAEQDLHVYVHASKQADKANQTIEIIKDAGGSAELVCFDVTDPDASKAAIEDILKAGPIQVFISNAGIHDDAPLAGMQNEQWHNVIDVSLNGFYHVCQPLLLPMMRTRWGRVIAVSSVAAVMGNRGQSNYAAAKSGLHGAIKSLSLELASRGVTANAVAPGVIQGTMTEAVFDKDQIKQIVPAQRAGRPEEVADLIAFLASDQADYISGQVVSINGGMA